jgi:ABC-type transport system involved in multi-copper enzyme maturation permease subunit
MVALFSVLFAAFASADVTAGSEGGEFSMDPESPATLRALYGNGFSFGYFLPLVLGIIGMTGEYRHQTITPSLLAVPRRGRLVAGKVLAYLLAGLGFGVVLTAAAVVAGGTVLLVRGFGLGLGAEGVPRTLLLAVLGCGVWAVFGLGLGTLLRNQVLAIVAVLVFVFIVETLLVLLLSRFDAGATIAQFLPGAASNAILAVPAPTEEFRQLQWWQGAGVLTLYGLVFAGLGAALTTRRDVT